MIPIAHCPCLLGCHRIRIPSPGLETGSAWGYTLETRTCYRFTITYYRYTDMILYRTCFFYRFYSFAVFTVLFRFNEHETISFTALMKFLLFCFCMLNCYLLPTFIYAQYTCLAFRLTETPPSRFFSTGFGVRSWRRSCATF